MRLLCTISIILNISTLAFSQQTNSAVNQTQIFPERLQEKIYAHLDRTDHLAGEILWFKLYVVDGMLHLKSDISKVAYVEIIDRNSQPVLQSKVTLEQGLGTGSFYLPSTLTTGNYSFRAYTNWMKNQGAEFFFHKPITIINTLKAAENIPNTTKSNIKLELFPEGGQLIESVLGRLAFKVVDETGSGVQAKVCLLNQDNDTIAKSNTLKFGMGRFEFIPRAGDQYTAFAVDANSRKTQEKLPTILTTGYSMLVTDSGNYIKVTVSSQQSLFAAKFIAHTRQSIRHIESKYGTRGSISFWIDRNKLGDGVSHFTIFNLINEPICERLYFKKPAINQLTIQANQKEYNIRRKVTLTVQDNESKKGNYSVSVFRADSLNDFSSIITNLYLTSDLVGFIEQPEFYFSEDINTQQAADNLMLTHGWRRFKWKELQFENAITYLPEVRGHLIQGRIVDNAGKSAAGKTGFLASPGKKTRIYSALSDANGIIRFQMKDFQSEGKVIAQTDYLKDSLLHLEIENPFSAKYINWSSPALKLDNRIESALISRSIALQVQDIFREDETYFSFAAQQADSIPFYGNADESYLLDDYTRFPAMEEVLREYVKSVWVRKNKANFRFRVIDKLNNSLFRENPLVLLDGVPIFDINQIIEFDPLKIKKLDVLTRKYYLGPVEFQGIVSYSTYNGDLGGFILDPRSITLNYEGLQQQREFHSPKYENQTNRNSRIPDQRHLLNWSPTVKMISGKSSTLDFYTSDVEGRFFIVVEGLSFDGTPVYGTSTFQVSK